MRSFIILCLGCIMFMSCKTKIHPSNLEIKTKEVAENSFVLEKESDFDSIEKSYIIYIKLNFGSRNINKDCNCPELEEKYILFKKDNISYIQKVVGDAVYYPIKLKSNHIISFYVRSFSEFRNEKIDKFKTIEGNQVYVFHHVLKKYILAHEFNKPITISFHEEDFQKDGFGETNQNYVQNKKLIFYKIDSLLNAEIDNLNKKDAFIFRKCRKE
ncbi:hypothetical protein [Chryseobacterium sp. RLHN22]|uniref:hypothetical protein n=1 Tax=Chryseobacterium sp. RLHN22 TaxID=3437885 RepID=UPI003D9B7480